MRSPEQQLRARRRGGCEQLALAFSADGRGRGKEGRQGKKRGRKPKGDKAGVSHAARPPLPSRYPVHVTLRLLGDVPRLRKRVIYRELRRKVFAVMHARPGFRVVHYSVQHNHVHLIVEARGREALSSGMQCFNIRLAKAINRAVCRKGTVFADRYHAVQLRSPTQTRNTLAYVLLNGRRHGEDRGVILVERWLDPYSSAEQFDGWRERGIGPPDGEEPAVAQAQTWLLTEGWRRGRGGLISILEVPGPPLA